jgi:hypothetical protein
MKRKKLLLSLLLAAALLAAWFEPTRCVRGVLRGEPFYDGRPASWWAAEWDHWPAMDHDQNRPYPAVSFVPPLLKGDHPAALPLLESLESHESAKVRLFARYGITQTRFAEARRAAQQRHAD